MIRQEIKNYNMILTEKQQKYQLYHLEKLINMNILQVKKYYPQRSVTKRAKFTYFHLGKALAKKTSEEQEKKTS